MTTISKHELTAVVDVGLGVTLDVIDARITLDDGWMPYIQAELTCWTPEEAELELLDPREQLRVTLTVTKEFGTWNAGQLVDQTRTFDLLLRGRTVDHTTGTMVLVAESDESLLEDLALVATTSERIYGLSVKDAVEYALDKIGAALEAGAADAEIQSAELPPPVTNLVPNPNVRTALGNWTNNGGGTITRQTGLVDGPVVGITTYLRNTFSSAVNGGAYVGSGSVSPATPAQVYTASVWVRANVAKTIRLFIGFRNSSGALIGTAALVTSTAVLANTWTRIFGQATAPAGTVDASPWADATAAWASGNTFESLGWMLTEGGDVVDAFDGDVADTGFIDYAWAGIANESASTRTYLPNSDAMIWRPGVTAWEYLEPLLQATGLRLYCNETREWILEPSGTARQGQVNIAAGINVTDAADQISRREEWYDSVVIIYTRDASWMQSNTYDIAGAPGTKTLVLEYDRPYPGPGAAQAVLNRAQGRGRILRLESISDYTATPGMTLSASLPDSPLQTGTVSSVEWSWPADRMRIGSRGLTDTPPEAWLLVEDLLTWEDIATGVDWTEYTPS